VGKEWERKRMEDPNLVIPPVTNLLTLEAVIEELENQPTPDLTSELMQVVRTVEKVATTAKNLIGRYIRALRMAALTVHAGTNLLACRIHGQAGSDADATIADLRKRNRALQLEKGRLEGEADQAAHARQELNRVRRDCDEKKRRIADLDQELREVKMRCIAKETFRSPPSSLLRLSASPRGGLATASLASFFFNKWRGWLAGSLMRLSGDLGYEDPGDPRLPR